MTIDERLAAAGLPPLPRRVWLEIDLDALATNVAVFREMIGPRVELSAVVKADAYGHGLVPVARAFQTSGVDRLCVASLDEAVALRKAGIECNILVLFAIPRSGLREAAERSIQVSITDLAESLEGIEQKPKTPHDQVVVDLEVETGLSRGGVRPAELPRAVRRIRTSGRGLGPFAVWTHVATAEDETTTAAQVAALERAVELARAAGEFTGVTRHMAATGGLLTGRVPVYEGVRIGLGLYGLLPLDLPIPAELRQFADRLVPAMTLKATALRVETFPAGTRVSYGGRWTAQRESKIATLPVGYADGFVRAYSPGAQAIVRGSRIPIVGVVAMDALMVDVTDAGGDIGPDDEFVLLGRQGGEEITAHELARLRNTIPWEVVTAMSTRVPRVYHAGSVLTGLRTLDGEVRAAGD